MASGVVRGYDASQRLVRRVLKSALFNASTRPKLALTCAPTGSRVLVGNQAIRASFPELDNAKSACAWRAPLACVVENEMLVGTDIDLEKRDAKGGGRAAGKAKAVKRDKTADTPGWASGLRQIYDSVVDEPLPDSFKDLLSKLDRKS
jgi:hypothetical protein